MGTLIPAPLPSRP